MARVRRSRSHRSSAPTARASRSHGRTRRARATARAAPAGGAAGADRLGRVPVYDLYLESGPQKKTTMVHVPALLGCIANGKTTDAALAATPDAIRAYLTYLRRHRADVDPKASIETRVVTHVTSGQFLGNGSPDVSYEPDLAPLGPAELRRYLDWLGWSRADLVKLVDGIDDAALDASPKGRGRPIRNILKH